MAHNNGIGKGSVPNKATFIYGSTGARDADATRRIKGGDLRSRPGKNAGR